MAQQPARPAGGFDMARVTTGQKIMGVSALLLFIDLFLSWQSVKGVCDPRFGFACGVSGFSGLGILVALLLIALLVWEGMLIGGINIPIGSVSPALIGAGIGAAAVLFTLIKFLTSLGGGPFGAFGIAYGAFVGLILALALGYGAWVRYQESQVATAGPSGPAAPPPPAP
jgi:hypothetical protein